MAGYRDPDLQERQKSAFATKKAMLEKFLAKANDPILAQREAERLAIKEARDARLAEREAAKKAELERLAQEAALAAERESEARRQAEEKWLR